MRDSPFYDLQYEPPGRGEERALAGAAAFPGRNAPSSPNGVLDGLASARSRGVVPEIGRGDVLIRIRSAAVPTQFAFAGREFAGEIVEVGRSVIEPLAPGLRVSAKGPSAKTDAVAGQGLLAEYVAIPASDVVRLPDGVSDDLGAILNPFAAAMRTARQFDLLGQHVLVTGAGPMGIMAAAIAREAGARSIVITDSNAYRLDLAARIVDVRPVNVTGEDLRDVMEAEEIQSGFGVALEMSGVESAMDLAVDALAIGGKLAVAGVSGRAMEASWPRTIAKSLTIKAGQSHDGAGVWPRMFGLIRDGLDLTPLITHRFEARAFQKAFAAALSGDVGKVVLTW